MNAPLEIFRSDFPPHAAHFTDGFSFIPWIRSVIAPHFLHMYS